MVECIPGLHGLSCRFGYEDALQDLSISLYDTTLPWVTIIEFELADYQLVGYRVILK